MVAFTVGRMCEESPESQNAQTSERRQEQPDTQISVHGKGIDQNHQSSQARTNDERLDSPQVSRSGQSGESAAASAVRPTAEADRHVPVVAVVLAAGFGTRFDVRNPKQLVAVANKPVVCWSIEAFEFDPRVTDIVVVVNPQVRDEVERLVDEGGYQKVRTIIEGGAERVDSTESALQMLADFGIPQDAKVLIHDSVRPFVERSSIDGCIDALDEFDAATVAVASTDTIVVTEDLGDRKVVHAVPDRSNMFRAQTPQAFRFSTIRHAYELASQDPDFHPTDDTRVVVDYLPRTRVAIVAGSESNMKITTQDDLELVKRFAFEATRKRAIDRVHGMLRSSEAPSGSGIGADGSVDGSAAA